MLGDGLRSRLEVRGSIGVRVRDGFGSRLEVGGSVGVRVTDGLGTQPTPPTTSSHCYPLADATDLQKHTPPDSETVSFL